MICLYFINLVEIHVWIIGIIIIDNNASVNLKKETNSNVNPFEKLIEINETISPNKIDSVDVNKLTTDISMIIIFFKCFNFMPNVDNIE